MPSSIKHQLNLYKINIQPLSSKGPWILSKLMYSECTGLRKGQLFRIQFQQVSLVCSYYSCISTCNPVNIITITCLAGQEAISPCSSGECVERLFQGARKEQGLSQIFHEEWGISSLVYSRGPKETWLRGCTIQSESLKN